MPESCLNRQFWETISGNSEEVRDLRILIHRKAEPIEQHTGYDRRRAVRSGFLNAMGSVKSIAKGGEFGFMSAESQDRTT